ncbi:MAG: hypothetical protein ABWZ63_12570 [Thermoleophilaceae bacterium]
MVKVAGGSDPVRGAGGAAPGERWLVELDLAVAPVLHDHRVVELQRVLTDQLADGAHDLLGLVEVVVGNRHQVRHAASPFVG